MKTTIAFLIVFLHGTISFCDFANYFEIKLKHQIIFNSGTFQNEILELERDSIEETDIIEIAYYECGMSIKNDYELHIASPTLKNDILFVSDEPKFIFNMGWLTQFVNKHCAISLHHTKYTNNQANKILLNIIELLIA